MTNFCETCGEVNDHEVDEAHPCVVCGWFDGAPEPCQHCNYGPVVPISDSLGLCETCGEYTLDL